MTIRDAVAADVPAMLAIYAPFVRETAVSFEYEVPSEAEFWQRIQAHRHAADHPQLHAFRRAVGSTR